MDGASQNGHSKRAEIYVGSSPEQNDPLAHAGSVVREVARFVPGATVLPAWGVDDHTPEPSAQVLVYGEERAALESLINNLLHAFNQKSILAVIDGEARFYSRSNGSEGSGKAAASAA